MCQVDSVDQKGDFGHEFGWETVGTKPTRLHFQNLIWRNLQTHSCNVQPVRPDPTRSPVQDISKQLVPKQKGLLDMGMCSEGTWQPPGLVAWDLQVLRPPRQSRQGWAKAQGWGPWSNSIQMAMFEINLTKGRNDLSRGVTVQASAWRGALVGLVRADMRESRGV